mmetsp:Transcript_10753/g.35621  ORF Transcript_10753/g.35621 Transcript_10753/m.35621 type:complete len:169 (+) Transcript_10753:99-605(+)
MPWFFGAKKTKRELGNEHFKQKDMDAAIMFYSEGLSQLVGSSQAAERATLLSNRSAAFASLERWHDALADADEAVSLRPDYAKAWARKGKAHLSIKDFPKAAAAYAKGLEVALKQLDDEDQRHTHEIDAVKSQAGGTSDEYKRLLAENASLKQQLEDYLLMFDKTKRG